MLRVPAPYTLKINLSSRGGISIGNVSHRLVYFSCGGISICNVLLDVWIWIPGPKWVFLFEKVITPLRGGVLLEELAHWRRAGLWGFIAVTASCSFSMLEWGCNVTKQFPVPVAMCFLPEGICPCGTGAQINPSDVFGHCPVAATERKWRHQATPQPPAAPSTCTVRTNSPTSCGPLHPQGEDKFPQNAFSKGVFSLNFKFIPLQFVKVLKINFIS